MVWYALMILIFLIFHRKQLRRHVLWLVSVPTIFLHCNLWPWYIHPYERTRPVNAVGDGTYFVATMKKLMQPGHPSHFQTLSLCRTKKQSQTPKRTSPNHFHYHDEVKKCEKYIMTLHDLLCRSLWTSKSDQILLTTWDHFDVTTVTSQNRLTLFKSKAMRGQDKDWAKVHIS